MNDIIQIIPAPEGLFAIYKDGGETTGVLRVMCLALVSNKYGNQSVEIMVSDGLNIQLGDNYSSLEFM